MYACAYVCMHVFMCACVCVYVCPYVRPTGGKSRNWKGEPTGGKGGKGRVRGRLDGGSVGSGTIGVGGDGLGGVAHVVVLGTKKTTIPSVPN